MNLNGQVCTHSELVLLRQLVHTQDSNDILEGLVVLEDLLHGGGDVVVLLADLLKEEGLSIVLLIYSGDHLRYGGRAYATWSREGRRPGRYQARRYHATARS